jgi:hypothetical protein
MPTFNIVVFAGDYCGPEVCSLILLLKDCLRKSDSWRTHCVHRMLIRTGWQVTAEAVKILKVVERCSNGDVKFDFQEHLLGGVSLLTYPYLFYAPLLSPSRELVERNEYFLSVFL